MQKYETVIIFDGALPEETIAKEQLKIEELIKENGNLVKTDVWGKKELAYEIDKHKTGFYSFFEFEYEGDANDFISSAVRYNEKVIRSMTVVASDDQIVAKKSDEATSEKEEA